MLKKVGSAAETRQLVTMLRGVDNIIIHEPGKEILLSGGGVSDFYIDVKRALGKPEARNLMVEMIARHVSSDVNFVATAGLGGVPLATDLSTLKKIRLCMIRDEEKKHGKGGFVEGFVPSESDRGVVIDDVLTTGGSVNRIRQRISVFGAEIVAYFVVVRRARPTLDFDVSYLLDVEDIMGNA